MKKRKKYNIGITIKPFETDYNYLYKEINDYKKTIKENGIFNTYNLENFSANMESIASNLNDAEFEKECNEKLKLFFHKKPIYLNELEKFLNNCLIRLDKYIQTRNELIKTNKLKIRSK